MRPIDTKVIDDQFILKSQQFATNLCLNSDVVSLTVGETTYFVFYNYLFGNSRVFS